MRTPAVTVSSRTAVSTAAELLAHHGFSAMPVIDHAGDLVGVVSEADLINNEFAAPEAPLGGGAGAASERPANTVGEVMTSPPVTVDQDDSLQTVVDVLISGHRRSVPVVHGRRVVGVLTRRDVLPFLSHVSHDSTPVGNPVPTAHRPDVEPRSRERRPPVAT